MRYLSVCSGIEAAMVAWHPLGFSPVAFAEVDRFPSAVLAHHYPDVPNLGDLNAFREWPDANIDVLVGGTPCQSFSVAGLRAGLADPRGNLALTYLAVADRYRPEWVVWENVPGVLSSGDGRDFGAFLGGLGELGYGFAYRVLDAQYFGLAQRRKRVFVVGHLGDWRRAAAVLFERESLSGHPAPRRETGESITGPIAGCSNGGGANGPGRTADDADSLVPERERALTSSNQRIDAETETLIPFTLAVGFYANGGAQGGSAFEGIAPTSKTGGLSCVAFDARQSDVIHYGDMSGPLDTDGHTIGVQAGMQVRRLTPRECEKLQGFPPDYTLIPYRGKPAADGPRYKALGNSMAVPCMAWIGQRIGLVQAHGEALAIRESTA